jgi:hypothetical protein
MTQLKLGCWSPSGMVSLPNYQTEFIEVCAEGNSYGAIVSIQCTIIEVSAEGKSLRKEERNSSLRDDALYYNAFEKIGVLHR